MGMGSFGFLRRMQSARRVIAYPIGMSGQTVILIDNVVAHLLRHRQSCWRYREAGGQLFARFDGKQIVVVEATGPRRTDRRTRTTYIPDRAAELREIADRHAHGLHFVGDWHTHPDRHPQPSPVDLASMAECVTKSTHRLNGFLLLIVGLDEPPDGIHASLHDGARHIGLTAVSATTAAE
jgi:integrative and conjugative element protein (TIGR02256 family)